MNPLSPLYWKVILTKERLVESFVDSNTVDYEVDGDYQPEESGQSVQSEQPGGSVNERYAFDQAFRETAKTPTPTQRAPLVNENQSPVEPGLVDDEIDRLSDGVGELNAEEVDREIQEIERS